MSSFLGSGSLGTGDLVGIVVGGVLALVTIIGIAISVYQMCCRKNPPPQQVAPYPPQYAQQNPYGQSRNTGYYQPQYNYPPGPYENSPPSNYPPQQQQQQSYPPQQQQQQSYPPSQGKY